MQRNKMYAVRHCKVIPSKYRTPKEQLFVAQENGTLKYLLCYTVYTLYTFYLAQIRFFPKMCSTRDTWTRIAATQFQQITLKHKDIKTISIHLP